MQVTNDGGWAFPQDYGTRGMTLRDYFAAKALPAVVAAYIEGNGRVIGADHTPLNCAAHAYKFADAMLATRLDVK